MLLPIQAPPKIRKGKSSTAKISNKMAGLMLSQMEDDEDMDFDEDMEDGEDMDFDEGMEE